MFFCLFCVVVAKTARNPIKLEANVAVVRIPNWIQIPKANQTLSCHRKSVISHQHRSNGFHRPRRAIFSVLEVLRMKFFAWARPWAWPWSAWAWSAWAWSARPWTVSVRPSHAHCFFQERKGGKIFYVTNSLHNRFYGTNFYRTDAPKARNFCETFFFARKFENESKKKQCSCLRRCDGSGSCF